MIIFPAIDLKGGQCVRLFKGDMNLATIFSDNPAAQAQEFEKAGFKFLHLVDLDGAIEGKSVNEESVKEILKSIKIPVQLGGGIRSLNAIEKWLDLGINRVILGTIAAKDPQFVVDACKNFPDKIVIGIDARDGKVAIDGWTKTSEMSAIELGKKLEYCGASAVIYTDISRDGTLTGFDFEGTKKLAESLIIPVIASGGISNIEDVKKVKELEKSGVIGAIVGRALYDKKIDLKQLIALTSTI